MKIKTYVIFFDQNFAIGTVIRAVHAFDNKIIDDIIGFYSYVYCNDTNDKLYMRKRFFSIKY
jgi:hypothetical protein